MAPKPQRALAEPLCLLRLNGKYYKATGLNYRRAVSGTETGVKGKKKVTAKVN